MSVGSKAVAVSQRSYSLARTFVKVLVYEGPKPLLWRLDLWLRKRWYDTRGRRVAERKLQSSARLLPGADAAQATSRQQPARSPRPAGALRVLFVVPGEDPFSKRYRVDNVRAHLQMEGVATAAVYNVDLGRRLEFALGFDVVVFHRMPATTELRTFAALARQRGVALAFDVDDYVFDPAMINYVPGQAEMPPDERARLTQRIVGCKAMVEECENFIASTPFLAERARELGRHVFLIRNGLNTRQLTLAERALAQRGRTRAAQETVRVGYLSGSKTHSHDVAAAIPALGRLLQDCPHVTLVIRGLLDIPDALLPYRRQIETRPFVSWERLVGATAELDVALAPLDLSNPFTEGKSALKYFEAALVAVPLVASPSAEFRTAIRQGETGFLAATEDEWYTNLHHLVTDRALRERVGQRARADALATYTPVAQSPSTVEVFTQIAMAKRQPCDVTSG